MVVGSYRWTMAGLLDIEMDWSATHFDAVLSDEVVSDLLGDNKALQRLEEITLGVVESHHGGPQARLSLSSLSLTSLISHCPRLGLIGDLARHKKFPT